MAMDTEESLKEYLGLQLRVPLLGRHRSAGPHVRLRGQRRAGREGDPHRRQGGLRGAGAPLRPRGRRRRGDRPHRRPAGQPQGHQRARAGRAWSTTRRSGCSTSSRTPPAPACVIVTDPRGDAGHRDHRAGRAPRRGDRRRPGRGRRQPGAARAVRPGRGGGVRAAAVAEGRGGARRPGRPRRGGGARRRPPRGAAAPHPRRATSTRSARRCRPPTAASSTSPSCSPAPWACA